MAGMKALVTGMCASLLAVSAGAIAQTESGVPDWPETPAGTPASDAPSEPSDTRASRSDPIETADDLLTALENAGTEMQTLSAGIRYTKIFGLSGDEQIRTGRLYYRDADAPGFPGEHAGRAFAVHFATLQLGLGEGARLDRERRSYIFDGEWLVESSPDAKQMIKRQVVPPGQTFDPLRIGEGPFPIPIGQRREEILERFEAELVDPTEGVSLLDPTGAIERRIEQSPAYQLRLTPREAFGDELDFEEIRLWYRAETLLPFLAWTITDEGDESVVELIGVKINELFPPGVMDTTTPDRGWNIEIREWRGRTGESP